MEKKINTRSKRILSMMLATLMILGLFISTGMLAVAGAEMEIIAGKSYRIEGKNNVFLGNGEPEFVLFKDGQIDKYNFAIWLPEGAVAQNWEYYFDKLIKNEAPNTPTEVKQNGGWFNLSSTITFFYGSDVYQSGNHTFWVEQNNGGYYALKSGDKISNTIWLAGEGGGTTEPDSTPNMKLLTIEKEADKDTVKVGETVTYTITISNGNETGTDDITGVSVTDPMLAYVTKNDIIVDPTYTSFTKISSTDTISGITISAGESIEFSYEVEITDEIIEKLGEDEAEGLKVVNKAELFVLNYPIDDSTVKTPVTEPEKINLSVEKKVWDVVSDDWADETTILVDEGEKATAKFQITLTSDKELPEEVLKSFKDEFDGDDVSSKLKFELDDRKADDPYVYICEYDVNNLEISELEYINVISSDYSGNDVEWKPNEDKTNENNPKEDNAKVTVEKKPEVGLTVQKYVVDAEGEDQDEKATFPKETETVTFKIVIENTGETDLTGLKLTDKLNDENADFTNATITSTIGEEETPIALADFNFNSFDLAKETTLVIKYTYKIDVTDVTAGETYHNVAIVTQDENKINEEDDATAEIEEDVTFDKKASHETIINSEIVTYTLTITNANKEKAIDDVEISDEMFEKAIDGEILVNDEPMSLTEGSLSLGTIDAGETVKITYSVLLTAADDTDNDGINDGIIPNKASMKYNEKTLDADANVEIITIRLEKEVRNAEDTQWVKQTNFDIDTNNPIATARFRMTLTSNVPLETIDYTDDFLDSNLTRIPLTNIGTWERNEAATDAEARVYVYRLFISADLSIPGVYRNTITVNYGGKTLSDTADVTVDTEDDDVTTTSTSGTTAPTTPTTPTTPTQGSNDEEVDNNTPIRPAYEPFTVPASANNAPVEPEVVIPEPEVTPEPEEEDFEEDEVPLAEPEPTLPDNTASADTEAKKVMAEMEEEIDDDDTPTDSAPDLPKTGGVSGILTALAGLGLFGAGSVLNKKKKDDDNQ